MNVRVLVSMSCLAEFKVDVRHQVMYMEARYSYMFSEHTEAVKNQ